MLKKQYPYHPFPPNEYQLSLHVATNARTQSSVRSHRTFILAPNIREQKPRLMHAVGLLLHQTPPHHSLFRTISHHRNCSQLVKADGMHPTPHMPVISSSKLCHPHSVRKRSIPRQRPPMIKQILEVRARRPRTRRRATRNMQVERRGARAGRGGRAGADGADGGRGVAAAAVPPHVVAGAPRRRQHWAGRRRRPEVALRGVAGAGGAAAQRVEVREARGRVRGQRRRPAAEYGGGSAACRRGRARRRVVPSRQEGRAAVCGQRRRRRHAVGAGACGRREE